MSPLSDEDVERIANRTAGKLFETAFKVVVVAVFAFLLVPTIVMSSLTAMASTTVGLPAVVSTLLTASVIAIPLVALVLAWSRTRPR